ncbi:MAG: phosphodiester glycosidase family protein [Clostridiaceae bacterium]|nr:phosphodiester glycosidase family protein [Clostridiaceae bacterium]
MRTKKITLFLLIIIIFNLLTTPFVSAQDTVIYEKTTEEIIARGVTRKNIVRFTSGGWLNINVIKADLNDPYLKVQLLTDSRGINYLGNVLTMAEQNNSVAAINADFFQWKKNETNRGNPIGPMVVNGKLLSSPAYDEKGMATLSVDYFNKIMIDYWQSKMTITAPNGKTATLKHINKYDALDSIVLYDRNWGKESRGSTDNVVEVVVVDNIVKEIRRGMPPVEIPENGYILSNLPEFDPFLIENFKVGDPVKLDISITPDISKLYMAVGGGTMLVKDGKPAPITHSVSGVHPRSAVGTDSTGKILYMVTVDGRQMKSKGMTLEELTQLLIQLGVYNAINMDGGGSTTLVAKPLGSNKLEVINRVSDGGLRNVANAIGIHSSAPATEVGGLIIQASDKNVFVGTSRTFTVKAYDKNYNPANIDMSKIKWSVSGVQGKFVGNTFYPSSAGRGKVIATYGENISASYDIRVLDAPASLSLSTKNIHVGQGDTAKISITGKDSSGYSASISLTDVKWDIPGEIATVTADGIKALKKGSGIITASLGQVNAHAYLSIDSGGVVDEFESINGTFLSYPTYVEGKYELSSEQKKGGSYSGKLTFDFTSEQTETKAAYLKLANDGIIINAGVEKIGLWVYGSSNLQHWLRGEIRDSSDQVHRIDFANSIDWDGWKYVEAVIPAGIKQPMRLTRLYVVQKDASIKNKGSIYMDNLTFKYSSTGVPDIELPEDKKLPDALNKPSELSNSENSFRFTVFGNTIKRKTLLDSILMGRVTSVFNKQSELSAFVGSIDSSTLSRLKTKTLITSGYHSFVYKGSTFIHLDNSNDGFRKTNANQWTWLKNTLNSISTQNVFLFLPRPITSFTDTDEAQLFKDMLSELAEKGKTILVFYNDEKTSCEIENGVRYISTAGIKKVDVKNIVSLVDSYQYILVTVNGNNVTYEIKKLF